MTVADGLIGKEEMERLKKIETKNRYRKVNRMTLVIGAKCQDGVVIIADRKVVDLERDEPTYENKILKPLGDLLAVASSGYKDAARQFNRKIPIIVDRRLKEYQLMNIKALKEAGYEPEEFLGKIVQKSKQEEGKQTTESVVQKEGGKDEYEIPIPYQYTVESFLDDCKSLIKEVSSDFSEVSGNPLQVLMAMITNQPVVHFIDSRGIESQIDSYMPIGSGSPYVSIFFERLWKPHPTVLNAIRIGNFVIRFIERMRLDNFVGTETGELPDNFVIMNHGRLGSVLMGNKKEYLEKVDKEIDSMDIGIKNLGLNIPAISVPELEGKDNKP